MVTHTHVTCCNSIADCSYLYIKYLYIECSTKANLVMVFGEITTKAKLDYVKIVRDTLEYIGYDDEEHGKGTLHL